ncbi:MAG: hypothetical protein R2710_05040 [Acidimicrobiales bacterium]
MAALEIATLLDLLTHYPRRYIDRTKEARIAELHDGEEASVFVTVKRTESRRIKGNRVMVTSTVTDGHTSMKLTFFNQHWRTRQLVEGREAVVYGKLSFFRNERQMSNPVVDLVGNQTGRIIPVYPQSEKSGLHTNDVVGFVAEALRRTVGDGARASLIRCRCRSSIDSTSSTGRRRSPGSTNPSRWPKP